jgi:hypothetical protein
MAILAMVIVIAAAVRGLFTDGPPA